MLILIPAQLLSAFSYPGLKDPPVPQARKVEAIVTTQWLEDHINDPDLVLLDVREEPLYAKRHITGSVGLTAPENFFTCFLDPDCGLWMEVPAKDVLFTTLGNAGITAGSTVVVITRTVDSPTMGPAIYGITMGARVAITLKYAGVENVALLDGGYDKWASEGRATSADPFLPEPVVYNGVIKRAMMVSKRYVEENRESSILVDARDANTYFGIEKDFTTARDGHIPSSKLLPAPWLWTTLEDESDSTTYTTWKDPDLLREISLAVLGGDMDEELIVYCGVGGYASPVFFILSEVMGYTNVKFYDGSMQEWTADPEAPVTKYKYE